MGLPRLPVGQERSINSFIWVAVGAIVGGLSGVLMGSGGKVVRIEEVLVGIFGAFIGGEFVSAMLNGGKDVAGFSGVALMTGIGGAVVMLLLLRMMRGAVGPMRSGKSPLQKRR